MILLGEYLTRNTGASPSVVVESSLSQILQTGEEVLPKYFLSAKACLGILRRAEGRGKELPAMLEAALREQAGLQAHPKIGHTLLSKAQLSMREDVDNLVMEPTKEVWAFIGKNSAKTRSAGETRNVSPTLDTGSNIQIAYREPNLIVFDNQGGDNISDSIAPTLRAGSHGSLPTVCRMQAFGQYTVDGTVATLKKGGYKNDMDVVVEAVAIENHPADSRLKLSEDGMVQTLTRRMGTGGGNTPMVPEPSAASEVIAFQPGNLRRDFGADPSDKVFPTLKCDTGDQAIHVAYAIRTAQTGANGCGIAEEVAHTLDLASGQAVAVDCRNLNESENSGTLQAKTNGGQSLNYINPVRVGYRVRRLTEIECERLQGMPDGWTAGISSSARYSAIGDSLAC